jgi:TorA maturation chaperone TorD
METRSQQHNLLKGYNMLLYFAGSMTMYEPSEECITDFWTRGILKKLPVSSSNPKFIKAAAQLRDSCEDKATCGKRLREDYIRLFDREVLPLAPVYESLYRKNGEYVSAGEADNVTEFYTSYGWESKFKGKINDDHVGIELLFLTIMVEKYLVLDDEACRGEMRKEIRRFIDQHILWWIPEWNDKMQKHANTICYKGIGTLIYACVEDLYNFLREPASLVYPDAPFKN